jgi:hypothetical protein
VTRLADEGTIYVTLSAAESYARATGRDREHEIEEARRRLTEILIDARPVEGSRDRNSEQWRVRSRTLGVDIQARVAYEGALCVVVHVYVRGVKGRAKAER